MQLHTNSNGYTFKAVRSDVEIEDMMNRARDAQYMEGIGDFAEGILAVLEWLYDDTEPDPMDV